MFLILKSTDGAPRPPADPPPPWNDTPEPAQPERAEPDAPVPVQAAAVIEPVDDMRMGSADQIEEAQKFAVLGKAMRLINPERPYETHLVGPDLSAPELWRHTLLVDDRPFSDEEFDAAEAAFLSALQTGAVPVHPAEPAADEAAVGHPS